MPELCDLLEGDGARRVVPGAVRERREPQLPGDLERIGRRRRAGGARSRYQLGPRLGPVEQPVHRVGDPCRGRELEDEPAETGERALKRWRRPGLQARRVRHALLAKVLGREHDDHVHGQLGVLGHDLGLTGGDDGLGVVELEAQVDHVRRPDGLEHEARLGRTNERGTQRLRQRLAIGLV